jgi:hypothetical protein
VTQEFSSLQIRQEDRNRVDALEARLSDAMGCRVYRADIAAAAFRLLVATLDGPEPDAVIWRAVAGEGER